MRRVLALVVIVTAPLAHAEPCPPAAALTGDADLVQAIRALLAARGIAEETPRCPAVHARIERRGTRLVVGVDRPRGAVDGDRRGVPASANEGRAESTIERAVSEVETAATVIESWTRSDVAAPLLARREVRAVEAAPAAVAVSPALRGIQLFAGEETSFASDRSLWQGIQLEACILLGPICAAARIHGAKVIGRPTRLHGFARKGGEIYIGIDVPIALGRARLIPGFAAGYGGMFTRRTGVPQPMAVEITGPRAEVHAAVSWPLTAHLAIDVVGTAALNQPTRIEPRGGLRDPSVEFPPVPRALIRFAVGVRYGAL